MTLRILVTFLVGFTAFTPVFSQSGYGSLQVPQQIQYQGRVSQNGAAWSGEGYFVFALIENGAVLWNNWEGTYDAATGTLSDPGSTVLADKFTTAQVSGGSFALRLGSEPASNNKPVLPTVFFNAQTNSVRPAVKLAVWFSADSQSFTRLAPDVSLASVPYAMVAGVAETVQDRTITTAKLDDAAVTTGKLAPAAVNRQALDPDSRMALVPAGTILPFGGNLPPAGYLLCDGAAHARTGTFQSLFSAIGTNFGAPDAERFNVPDLRGQFLRGAMPNLQVSFTGSPSNNRISAAGHPFNRTGMRVRVVNPVSGLAAGTDYFVVNSGAAEIAFATSHFNALLGFVISLSGTATGMVVSQAEDPDAALRRPMAPGGTGLGESVGSLQEDELRAHSHTLGFRIVGGVLHQPGGPTSYAADSGNPRTNSLNTGGSETRPKNASVNYIIKF